MEVFRTWNKLEAWQKMEFRIFFKNWYNAMSDDELIEWVDHSNASALEEFISELENLLVSWGMTEISGGELLEQDFRQGELKLGRDVYQVLLVTKRHQEVELREFEKQLSFAEVELLKNGNLTEPYEDTVADVERWFGVQNYLVICPKGRSGNLNDVSLLLSCATVTASICYPPIPVFVPASKNHESSSITAIGNQVDYYGVCSSQFSTTHFDETVIPIKSVPPNLHHLAGLTDLFRSKVSSYSCMLDDVDDITSDFKRGHIVIDVQHVYKNRPVESKAEKSHVFWSDWLEEDATWRLHIEDGLDDRRTLALRGGSDKPPLWGPVGDIIGSISLRVSWPMFNESTRAENATFTSFIPESAPIWLVDINVADKTLDDAEVNTGIRIPCESEKDEVDMGAQYEHWMCPLSTSLRYLYSLKEGSRQYRNCILSDVYRPNRRSLESDDAQYTPDHKLVSQIILELFTPLPDAINAHSRREQLVHLKRLNLQGDLSLKDYSIAKQSIMRTQFDRSTAKPIRFRSSRCWMCYGDNPQKAVFKKTTQNSVGCLLSIFALRMVPRCGGSMEALSIVWKEFVAELRYYWDHMLEIPLNQVMRDVPVTMHSTFHVLYQKLVLLNMCISMRAHFHFKHTESDYSSEDEFYDAEEEPANGGASKVPWTLTNTVLPSYMNEENIELLRSLASNEDTSQIHARMLENMVVSEMSAFKACNPNSKFTDYTRIVRSLLGPNWKTCWEETEPKILVQQLEENPKLFNHMQEAEKILHHLETISPELAVTGILEAGLESAEYILDGASQQFEKYVSLFPLLSSSFRNCKLHMVPSNDERCKLRINSMERCEFLLGLSCSLLHKFPEEIVASLLTEEMMTGHITASIPAENVFDRQNVRALLFQTADSMPQPCMKEYLFRCLSKSRIDSSVFGVNRMYVAINDSNMTIGTALTETISY